jgi:ribosomal protein S18 acetylase RimI-like enzyme
MTREMDSRAAVNTVNTVRPAARLPGGAALPVSSACVSFRIRFNANRECIVNLEIRTARANDSGPVAELMCSSALDLYHHLYGDDAVPFLRHEFTSGGGIAGHRNVTVAVHAGEIVGAGCFFDRDQRAQLRQETYHNLLAFFGEGEIRPIIERMRGMKDFVTEPAAGELYLANFGVAPQLRSKGIGSRLIQHKLAWARANGYRLFGLDVAAANPRGEALYTRLGLRVVAEKSFPDASAQISAAKKMEMLL